tara:strand:+ start:4614 stop:4919 length:306 start_codon:yes stop_codon:yes gene_type:complete
MKTKIMKWVKDLVKKHHRSCKGKSLEFLYHEVSPTGGYKPHNGDQVRGYDSIAMTMMNMKEGYIDTWVTVRVGFDDWDMDNNPHFPKPVYFNIDQIMKGSK